jgi:S-adenosylmethionine:diacylglycerol 3-amino-3-carboxypropyl transferase
MDLFLGSDWIGEERPVREGDAVVAAAEGGDRVLRMLAARPRRIAVLDRHPAQLRLLELKLAGVKALAFAEYLELTGLRPSRRRRALYQRVRWLLGRETDEFWLSRLDLLDRGVASQGVFERRLASFRSFVRLVHGRRKVERFLTLRNEADRRAMYAGEWQTFLWRQFGAMLWRRWFEVPAARLEKLLFEGRLLAPPDEPDAAAFEAAKELANRVIVAAESPEEHLRSLPAGSIDAFLLGRLDVRGLEDQIARVAAPGARMCFVTDRRGTAVTGFVAEELREADFFPGWLVAGRFAG